MLEHPDITFYNRYGYLRDNLNCTNEEKMLIGHCSICNDSVYYEDDKVIRYDDYYFCNQSCLLEAVESGLIEDPDC